LIVYFHPFGVIDPRDSFGHGSVILMSLGPTILFELESKETANP